MNERELLVRDLTQCFYDIRRREPRLSQMEICDIISRMPAPRYYRSVSYARKIINQMAIGKPRASVYRISEMHKDIYSRWLGLSKKDDDSLQAILSKPAPSFYLSKHRIYKLLYRNYGKIY